MIFREDNESDLNWGIIFQNTDNEDDRHDTKMIEWREERWLEREGEERRKKMTQAEIIIRRAYVKMISGHRDIRMTWWGDSSSFRASPVCLSVLRNRQHDDDGKMTLGQDQSFGRKKRGDQTDSHESSFLKNVSNRKSRHWQFSHLKSFSSQKEGGGEGGKIFWESIQDSLNVWLQSSDCCLNH